MGFFIFLVPERNKTPVARREIESTHLFCDTSPPRTDGQVTKLRSTEVGLGGAEERFAGLTRETVASLGAALRNSVRRVAFHGRTRRAVRFGQLEGRPARGVFCRRLVRGVALF